MKARQTKKAKKIFDNEEKGRKLLKEIQGISARETHVYTSVNFDEKRISVNEL